MIYMTINNEEFKTKMIDKMIDEYVEMYKNEEDINDDDLVDFTNYLVDEWISCSGINGYVYSELEKKFGDLNDK